MGYYSVFDAQGSLFNYKYNGKELQETGMYAMDFRHYMPDIGRFTGMDALSEMYTTQTPYHFSLNNPANFSDPTGLYTTDSNGNISTSNQDEIHSLMGYFQGGGSVNGVNNFISGNSTFSQDLPEVTINARGNSKTWNNSQNYGYNSLLMYSKADQARRDWNLSQARSTLYDAYENTKIGQEIGAFERFLFLEMPLNLAGGELLSAGWRAAGLSKLLWGARSTALGSEVAKTFQFGRYSEVVLDKPIVLSRYYDNVSAFAKGRYMTDAISNPLLDRIGLAIKPSWNAMTEVASWEIPAGSTIYKGRAAMQFPWIGGKTQYFVPDLSNITRVMP